MINLANIKNDLDELNKLESDIQNNRKKADRILKDLFKFFIFNHDKTKHDVLLTWSLNAKKLHIKNIYIKLDQDEDDKIREMKVLYKKRKIYDNGLLDSGLEVINEILDEMYEEFIALHNRIQLKFQKESSLLTQLQESLDNFKGL